MANIDEEVDGHKLAIIGPYSQKTSLSPIFRLPVEALTAIFTHCAQDDYAQLQKNGCHGVPTWVNISYACRHWRNVTLNCPTLWSYLFTVSIRWVDELLVRSKQAPLKLFVALGLSKAGTGKEYIVEQALSHIERIQELHIVGLPVPIWIFPKLPPGAPSLQILRIFWDVEGSEPQRSFVPFDGDTPSLRTLELSRCPVPWYLFKLNSLKTLTLDCIPARCQPDLGIFLVTLGCMPDLIHLNLHLQHDLAGIIDFLFSKAFHAFQKINLSHLSRASVLAPLPTLVTLLSCIFIPSKAEVRLRCIPGQSPHDKRALLTSIIQQRLNEIGNQSASDPTGRSGSMFFQFAKYSDTWNTVAILDVGASEHVWVSSKDVNPLRNHVGNILFYIDFFSSDIDNFVLRDVCSTLSSAGLQILHVVSPPSSKTFWRRTLVHFPNLRRLVWDLLGSTIMDDFALLLPRILHGGKEKEGGRNSDALLVPALEELELRYLCASGTQLQSLYDALASRNASWGVLTIYFGRQVEPDLETSQIGKRFDIVGRWADGLFYIVRDSRVSQASSRLLAKDLF